MRCARCIAVELASNYLEAILQKPNTILIIDDDEHVLMTLKAWLQHESYDTATAGSGREAFELFRSGEFDLLLLDDSLPDMDSEEILRETQRMKAPPQVIVMQAKPTFDAMSRFTSLGAANVMGKWMPRREISQAIRNCLAPAVLHSPCTDGSRRCSSTGDLRWSGTSDSFTIWVDGSPPEGGTLRAAATFGSTKAIERSSRKSEGA